MLKKKNSFADCKELYNNIFGSEEYKKYINEQEEKYRNHLPINTDYYDDFDRRITKIQFIDSMSNEGASKLLKKLYHLPKKKYKVKNYYKEPFWFRKYDYVHLQCKGKSIGYFAEIEFLDDKYIESVVIRSSQLNSFFLALEYEFNFKKAIAVQDYDDFIKRGLQLINEDKDYVTIYNLSDDREIQFSIVSDMNDDYFSIVCQHYITSMLYSETGRMFLLPSLIYQTRNAPIVYKNFCKEHVGILYYAKKRNFFILDDLDDRYTLYSGNNFTPSFSFLSLIFQYGSELFTLQFGQREVKIFEYQFSKYVTGRKKPTYNKDYYWLLNKMQSFSEICRCSEDFYTKFDTDWELFVGTEKKTIKKYHKNVRINFRDIYSNHFNYMKMHTEILYTRSNRFIAVVALIVAIITLVVTVA